MSDRPCLSVLKTKMQYEKRNHQQNRQLRCHGPHSSPQYVLHAKLYEGLKLKNGSNEKR